MGTTQMNMEREAEDRMVTKTRSSVNKLNVAWFISRVLLASRKSPVSSRLH